MEVGATAASDQAASVYPEEDRVGGSLLSAGGVDVQVEAVLVAHQELRLRTDNVDLLSVWLVAGFLKTSRAAHFMST